MTGAGHGKLQFTAPLTVITAAVVGVIASFALFFIAHTSMNTRAGGIFISKLEVAALALLRYKWGVIPVIAGCALAGLALRLAGWA